MEAGKRPQTHTFGRGILCHRKPLVPRLNQTPQSNAGIKRKQKKGGGGVRNPNNNKILISNNNSKAQVKVINEKRHQNPEEKGRGLEDGNSALLRHNLFQGVIATGECWATRCSQVPAVGITSIAQEHISLSNLPCVLANKWLLQITYNSLSTW